MTILIKLLKLLKDQIKNKKKMKKIPFPTRPPYSVLKIDKYGRRISRPPKGEKTKPPQTPRTKFRRSGEERRKNK